MRGNGEEWLNKGRRRVVREVEEESEWWMSEVRKYCGFFFQAEDGIRDHCVTGVQTCALPIYEDFIQRGRYQDSNVLLI